MQAVVLGASGAVGREVCKHLVLSPDFVEVVCLVRRLSGFGRKSLNSSEPLSPAEFEGKIVERAVDFSRREEFEVHFVGIDVVFCCLGSTMNAAGSEDKFREIDQLFVVDIARIAKRAGVKYFSYVSSIGANPQSGMFYFRVKGETEQQLMQIHFRSLSLFRPSVLIADRAECRCGESCAVFCLKYLLCLCMCCCSHYDAIPVSVVAGAMVADMIEIYLRGKTDPRPLEPHVEVFDGSRRIRLRLDTLVQHLVPSSLPPGRS
eukprot:gnl/Spiro4/13542_TR7213_c0_g1_i1.p1 gnl/Spiro4/13542_TR7213_c0_g1~~gnl/Spiro4/13542_TR7213_c0_g1_i1.p1  ORF type:complete len:262 (-),score=52.26 gnl/Spiro4/13542_TR7213_c0_g1_i1:158-943(-)